VVHEILGGAGRVSKCDVLGAGEEPRCSVNGAELRKPFSVLRTGRVSVVIRRLVHYSWYEPAGERPRWEGTNWKGSAGQGPGIRTRQALDRQSFLMSISIRPR
jgi:hypothetical protein